MAKFDEEGRSLLAPEVAVATLSYWLQSHDASPSKWLEEIFAEAGRLVSSHALDRSILSTRLLLFAAAELGQRITQDSTEARAIKAVSKLLRKDAHKFGTLFSRYFTPEKSDQTPGRVPTISGNLQQILAKSLSSVDPSLDAGLVTASDFLMAYPLEGSRADEMLGNLGISKSELHTALLEAIGPSVPTVPKKQVSTSSRPRKRKPFNERVSTHIDEPATADQLGRRHFAQVLKLRIEQVRPIPEVGKKRAKEGAFIVHLHGPWGSGKSSVLNFLQKELEENSTPPWIVVNFNAWRDQRLQPPWWTLIATIYSEARSKLGWRAPVLWLRWQTWRLRADYLPIISVLVGALLVLMLIWLGYWSLGSQAAVPGKPAPISWFDIFLKLAPVAMTIITILGAIYVGSRTLALGSRHAAQAYAELKADPYKPIATLFKNLVEAIDRPLAVFIDDLDRCDAKYVVELLEGIQTLMRGAAVTYVVAADRKWICSSFEQRYSGFSEPIGQPGRPLGYLFLDKMFQISAALPHPSPEAHSGYWLRLLSGSPEALEKHQEQMQAAERKADSEVETLTSPEQMRAAVKKAEKKAKISGDIVTLQATRAAVAKRVASQDAVDEAEHRLRRFAPLVEPNPRAMKRLVNAYALHQSTLFLSGSDTIFNTLARWTILELRWPLLADLLAIRPEYVDKLRSPLGEDELPQITPSLRRLFGDEPVLQVIGPKAGRDRLSQPALRSILGAVQGDR